MSVRAKFEVTKVSEFGYGGRRAEIANRGAFPQGPA